MRVTQEFGANPHIYNSYGLVGHEGIDLRAPIGTPVKSMFKMQVYRVGDDRLPASQGGHNYGVRVYGRILNSLGVYTGYRIVYAHLDSRLVNVGDVVSAGNIIGLSGNTGNSSGPHLHITMYKDGATDNEETFFPFDIIDPTAWFLGFNLERPYIGEYLEFYYDLDPPVPPLPTEPVVAEYGIHDEAGAEWMRNNNVKGYSVHSIVCRQPTTIDFSRFAERGIKVIVRLNWGYYPDGTLPSPFDLVNQAAFIDACIATINSSSGVWGWVIGNECNNQNEWPSGINLTADYYASIYNSIAKEVPADRLISVAAVDPYHPVDGGAWWRRALELANRVDFLTYHPKTQSSNPQEIWSTAKFQHPPLQYQYLHMRAFQTLMDMVPSTYPDDMLNILTEVNPQRKLDGVTLGWDRSTSVSWFNELADFLSAHNEDVTKRRKVHGVVIYRWDFDQWAIREDAALLNSIKLV